MGKTAKWIQRGNLFEALSELSIILQHDIGCWRDIANDTRVHEIARIKARERVEALRIEADQLYEAMVTYQKESEG